MTEIAQFSSPCGKNYVQFGYILNLFHETKKEVLIINSFFKEDRYDCMKYNRTGESGLLLPAMSFGIWHSFGYGSSYENARKLICGCFDMGITHIDAANNYGPPEGSAEETLGRILKQDLKGYRDELIVTGEPFALWVIECPKDISVEFPLHKAGLPVIYTDNQKPYKQRKVRILNGAHTSFVLASFLAGNDIVLESMKDEIVFKFMKETIFDEVIPTLTLPRKDLEDFAQAVITRFNNPYVKHALLSISLNSVSKWRARCMPSFLGYVDAKGELPAHLTFSLAALMAFYKGTEIRDKALVGHRDGQEYQIMDDRAVLEFFAQNSEKPSAEFAQSFLENTEFFGQDLTQINGLVDAVASYLDEIADKGMRKALEDNFR